MRIKGLPVDQVGGFERLAALNELMAICQMHREPITAAIAQAARRLNVSAKSPAARDLRWPRIEQRKRTLAKAVRDARLAVVLNEHYEAGGEIVFKHGTGNGRTL